MGQLDELLSLLAGQRRGLPSVGYAYAVDMGEEIEVFKGIARLCRSLLVLFQRAGAYHPLDLAAGVGAAAGTFVKGALAKQYLQILLIYPGRRERNAEGALCGEYHFDLVRDHIPADGGYVLAALVALVLGVFAAFQEKLAHRAVALALHQFSVLADRGEQLAVLL